jgi:hypothetical protein
LPSASPKWCMHARTHIGVPLTAGGGVCQELPDHRLREGFHALQGLEERLTWKRGIGAASEQGNFWRGWDSVRTFVSSPVVWRSAHSLRCSAAHCFGLREESVPVSLYTVSVCWVHFGWEAASSWLHCAAVACGIQHAERFCLRKNDISNHSNGQQAAAHLAPRRDMAEWHCAAGCACGPQQ